MLDNISRYSPVDIDDMLTDVLGERYASYRRLWNRVTRECVPAFPIHLDVEVNDKCNKSCIMCPRNTRHHPNINYAINTGSVLDFQTYQKIIDEGAEKGLMSVNLGAFGEPLLHKDVFRMVNYAHQLEIIDSRIITNGLLLHRFTEDIFTSGLVNLFVSLDAFYPETYYKVRGSGFEQIKSNLLNFIAEKERRKSMLPIVRVSFVKMNVNTAEEEKFVEFWRDKVEIIDVQLYDDFNFDVTRPVDKSLKKKWNCRSPWHRMSVLANGNILPCCNFYGWNIPIGNVFENSIEEAWNSDKMAGVREGILRDSSNNCSICQRVG